MSFDRLAPHYRWMELLLAGRKLQRARTRWLGELNRARRVLLVGEGNGRFLAACAHRLPQARFICIDASAAMLREARERWQRNGGQNGDAEFVHAQLPDAQLPTEGFDSIVTHFFLDCFPEPLLEAVIAALARAAKPQARWLAADFCEAPRGLARVRSRIILWLMYRFFRIATRLPAHRLINPDTLLTRHGFQLRARQTTEWGLLHSDLWQRDVPPTSTRPNSSAVPFSAP